MAMSLEELLVKEGFRGRRSKTMPKGFIVPEEITKPRQDAQKSIPRSGIASTGRMKSEMSLYDMGGESPASDKGKKPMHNFTRSYRESNTYTKHSGEIVEYNNDEIVEVGVQNRGRYNQMYSSKVYNDAENEGKYLSRNESRGKYRHQSGENIGNRSTNNSNKSLIARKSFGDDYQESVKHPAISCSGSSKLPQASRSFDNNTNHKQAQSELTAVAPALDEAAVKAIVSIFSEYANRFIKDEDFRVSLRHNSFASLKFVGQGGGLNNESKVIKNLEQAIETVERAAEESATAKELKRASVQLSVITGLHDLRDEFTSGVPNFKLSACAHLYLSVIYKIQKKDKIAVKHLLQVFCDSPFQARTKLLNDLWDHMFLPHFSHLKVWYKKQADCLLDSPIQARKLKCLEKMYNEILDSATFKYANYYKGWLTEGVEAPSIPSIHTPSKSAPLPQRPSLSSKSSSPIGYFPPQPMVSKRLYDAVIANAYKSEVEIKDYEEENFVVSARSSNCSVVEEKQSFASILEKGMQREQAVDPEAESQQSDVVTAEEDQRYHLASSSQEIQLSEKFGYQLVNALQNANELILRRLAKAVFGSQQTEKSAVDTPYLLPQYDDALCPESLRNNLRFPFQELQGSEKHWNGTPIFPSIPKEYICPLTGLLFEDPVTLETGQTFERPAVARWLEKGSITCPVTGKALECQAVPVTNFILKHIIDNWKSVYYRRLLALASQVERDSQEIIKSKDKIAVFILEQLIFASSQEEKVRSVKQLMSLGGLQFLIKRFHSENLEERTSVAGLLLCCIETDTACRNHVSRSIDHLCLLELLHIGLTKSRLNAIMLLTEFICQNRRKDAKYFLRGFKKEEIKKAKDALLLSLQSCPDYQKPLVAVLILNLSLLVEPQKYSTYIEEATNAIATALKTSLSNEKVREGCCKALLFLGARFSSCGKLMTEDWILKQAGFLDGPESDLLHNQDEFSVFEENTTMIEDINEEEATERWLTSLSVSLLRGVNKPFLETISKCLASKDMDLVRVCLTTVVWLTSSLASLPETELQLSAFKALISPLRESMETDHLIELKILASMSLFNLSCFPECRASLMKIAKEMSISLKNLAEVTWSAKKLYGIISGCA